MRHVRGLWTHEQEPEEAELRVGNLLVEKRRYRINGVYTDVPGHIGIVSSDEHILHARISKQGSVEQMHISDIQYKIYGILDVERIAELAVR